MSRGLGKLQQAILHALPAPGTEVLFNKVFWDIVDGQPHQADPSPSSYKAFHRAVKSLKGSGMLEMAKRKFSSLDELCMLYPYRTMNRRIRDMRAHVLPFVKQRLEMERADGTKETRFTALESESHLRDELSPETRSVARGRWLSIEPKLFDLLVAVSDQAPARQHVLQIIAKGQGLFIGSGVNNSRTMIPIWKAAMAALHQLPSAEEVLGEVLSLYDSVFPRDTRRNASLKNRLYVVADFSRNRQRVALKQEFKEWLLQQDRDYVSGLPRHHVDHTFLKRVHFSDLLDQVLGRDSLSEAIFLSAPES
jgi:hypothetical protein